MDLLEAHHTVCNRHPWELSRIRTLRAIAEDYGLILSGKRILDIGCGDGFLIDGLCPDPNAIIDAVDINLNDSQVRSSALSRPRVRFHNDVSRLPEKAYGLLTMFDVLEHIPDEIGFLRSTVARFPQPEAFLFLTVPAFQYLFSAHDRFLLHQRRYSRSGLCQVLGRAGLEVIASGYLFASLLPIRALLVVREKIFGAVEQNPGVGNWQRGRFLTSLLTTILIAENLILFKLARMGIVLPGLTVWAICKIPR